MKTHCQKRHESLEDDGRNGTLTRRERNPLQKNISEFQPKLSWNSADFQLWTVENVTCKCQVNFNSHSTIKFCSVEFLLSFNNVCKWSNWYWILSPLFSTCIQFSLHIKLLFNCWNWLTFPFQHSKIQLFRWNQLTFSRNSNEFRLNFN